MDQSTVQSLFEQNDKEKKTTDRPVSGLMSVMNFIVNRDAFTAKLQLSCWLEKMELALC